MPDVFTVDRYSIDVLDYTIEERCGQHDLLTVVGSRAVDMYNYVGKPASLEILLGSNSRIIVGYLDTEVTSRGQKKETVTAVYVLGASSAMRSGVERQWKNKRPFEIAADVVRPYGFCLEMDTYNYTLPLFIQKAESDWQMLNRLAQDIGMQLIGTNTVIRIIDPVMEIRRRQLRPLFTADVTVLKEFSISRTPVPIGYESRVFAGIDKFGESFSVTANEGASVTLPAPETVKSLEDAINAKDRIERRRVRLRRARCVMKYNPVLRSGTTVALTNKVNRNVWFIGESKHSVTKTDSQTELTLYRDEDDQRVTTGAWRQASWPQPVKMQDKWLGSMRWEREL